jgi:toxin ParE1/3/4
VKVVWTLLAEQRAIEAAQFIAQDKRAIALGWYAQLGRHVASLSRFPRRGRVVPEMGQLNVRELFHAPYRIIYRIGETRIEIVSIWHGRRALDPRELDLGELAT